MKVFLYKPLKSNKTDNMVKVYAGEGCAFNKNNNKESNKNSKNFYINANICIEKINGISLCGTLPGEVSNGFC